MFCQMFFMCHFYFSPNNPLLRELLVPILQLKKLKPRESNFARNKIVEIGHTFSLLSAGVHGRNLPTQKGLCTSPGRGKESTITTGR